ncbi:MAG TPA: hypothetical protein EYG69_02940 [Campylobacterales bacterium]|nr:hypothetical protein [Campylobacterales bacterium]
MSLKENISAVKEELNTEEQFLESVIKVETIFKKYKKLIIGGATIILVTVFASLGYSYIQEKNLNQSNKLYLSLIKKDVKVDEATELELKNLNPKLYELYKYQTTVVSADKDSLQKVADSLSDPILKSLLSYQIASLNKKDLLIYSQSDGAILKDFAIAQAAIVSLENNDTKKAKDALSFIGPSSVLYQISQSLKHYIK